MCISPLLIKNPYRGLSGKSNKLIHDTTSYFIRVPCGRCPQCKQLKQSYLVQRAQLLSFDHYFFFCTLTYNHNISSIDVNGYNIKYANYDDFRLFIKRLRRDNVFNGREWKYLAVSEFGSKKHRPHWHIIFAVKKEDSDNEYTDVNLEFELYNKIQERWARNVGSDKHPIYEPLFTKVSKDGRSNFDFHLVHTRQNDKDDVYFYVTKYVLKYDKYVTSLQTALRQNLPPDEFKRIWKIVKPKFYCSKGFGKADTQEKIDYLRSCLDRSSEFPQFVSPSSGFIAPMSPYLRKNNVTQEDYKRYQKKRKYVTLEGVKTYEDAFYFDNTLDQEKREQVLVKFNNMLDKINSESYD